MSNQKITPAQHKKMMESPALDRLSSHYPAMYKGKVPYMVKMVMKVPSPTLPAAFLTDGNMPEVSEEYPVWVNSHGAVAVIFENGTTYGVVPNEFEVVKWHE